MRVDAHVHIGRSDTGDIYYPPLEGEEWLALMEGSGMERAIVFAPTMNEGYRRSNKALRDWAARQDGRIRVLARLGGPQLPLAEPAFWLVRRALRQRVMRRPPDLGADGLDGFAGVKLLPQLDGIPSRHQFEEIADRKLPVLSHAGRFVPARWLARHVLPRTRGPLILAHLGSFPAEHDLIEEAIALAEAEPCVHLDTSGIWDIALLRRAIEAVPRKLIFGSDAPLTHPLVAWRQVERLIADPGLRARIGGDLAEELFVW